MRTLDRLKHSIDHLDRMEYNIIHFHSMIEVCKPEFTERLTKHLHHAQTSAKQDRINIAQFAKQLLEES